MKIYIYIVTKRGGYVRSKKKKEETKYKKNIIHIGYRGCFLGARTLYRPNMAPIGLLNVPKDSMGCLDNIQHPKSTKYSSYKD